MTRYWNRFDTWLTGHLANTKIYIKFQCVRIYIGTHRHRSILWFWFASFSLKITFVISSIWLLLSIDSRCNWIHKLWLHLRKNFWTQQFCSIRTHKCCVCWKLFGIWSGLILPIHLRFVSLAVLLKHLWPFDSINSSKSITQHIHIHPFPF